MKLIKNWHIVISGFLQHEGQANGMVGLWRKIKTQASRQDPLAVVMLKSWNDNFEHLAELIWRISGQPANIKIYAYSWGGYSATVLSNHLLKRNMNVSRLVLSDPIHRLPLWTLRWISMLGILPIRIPRNVIRVDHYSQRNNRPSGHYLVCSDPRTILNSYSDKNCIHKYMDDSPKFHNRCLAAMEDLTLL